MDRIVNKVKIFCNNNVKSNDVKRKLIAKLIENDFEIVDDDYDLAIAIGGDGSFLRMVKSTNFNSDTYYIGIDTGTLGFAQEVNADDLDEFIDKLNNNSYKVEEIGIEEIIVEYEDGNAKFYALNDITIRDAELNTCKLDIFVEDRMLENFVGDGILISTSFGSTAYNLSFGGAIVYNSLHTLQITSIAPLNSKAYRSLINSVVIPQDKEILIKPKGEKTSLIVTVDGENIFYEGVKTIRTFVKNKYIKCFREQDYNFISKVNDKFLK